MDINLNLNRIPDPGSNSQPVAKPAPAAAAAAPAGQDGVSLHNASALEQALNNVPDVRPEKVEQARQLVADTDYPSDKVMGGIAQLLSQHIQNQ
jgi:hypothetical protein